METFSDLPMNTAREAVGLIVMVLGVALLIGTALVDVPGLRPQPDGRSDDGAGSAVGAQRRPDEHTDRPAGAQEERASSVAGMPSTTRSACAGRLS